MRVRAFTQDDAHSFCTEDQITEETGKVCRLLLSIYEDFGFDDVVIKFADRPPKRVGDDAAHLKKRFLESGIVVRVLLREGCDFFRGLICVVVQRERATVGRE